jgi:hypothetical protein
VIQEGEGRTARYYVTPEGEESLGRFGIKI